MFIYLNSIPIICYKLLSGIEKYDHPLDLILQAGE